MLLHELTPQGSRHVAECLRRGDVIELGPEHEVSLGEVDVGDLDHLERMVVASPLDRPALDPMLAELLHRSLRLGRRLASRRAVWAWLGVSKLWPVLTRRWPTAAPEPDGGEPDEAAPGESPEPVTKAPPVTRFLGRLYEHGLARAWWAAELTVDGAQPDPYEDTRRLTATQYAMDRLLRSELGRNRTVLLGILDALGDTPSWRHVGHVVAALSQLDTTVALDALSREEVARLAEEMIATRAHE
ncbi:MAG: DUF6339 family protein [Myxococcota bacterium]